MNWLPKIGHGIARLFTIPRSVRSQLNANPLAPTIKTVLAAELGQAIDSVVNNHIKDPAAAGVIQQALNNAVQMTGILQ